MFAYSNMLLSFGSPWNRWKLYVFAVSALHVHLLTSIVEISKLVKCCHFS